MPLNIEGTPYPLLRHLTLPVCAITTSANGRRNGFIVNSAQRASLVPSVPRISLYISKPNFSHDLAMASGVLGVHLLRADQWDVIRALGLRSARDVPDKLADLAVRTGATGCPMLADVRAAFECRIINAMDAGGATFVLADVVEMTEGTGDDVLTSEHFRRHMPDDVRRDYEAGLARAQQILEPLSRDISREPWRGPVADP
ncbi:MAG TPA: flavin reductase family protein [Longimicrobiales bacterium]|nr:flavin reductase family protein [Longimicrobiales bacterium]